ncbi:MAG: tail fiber domain-containing protein [Pseudonocardia sp.]
MLSEALLDDGIDRHIRVGGSFFTTREKNMAGPVLIDIPNENTRAVLIKNLFNQTHQTGMRVTNQGFFHITNRIPLPGASGGTEARLDSGGNWTKASDRRQKRDIQEVSDLLEKVLSLEPVEFYYNSQDLEAMPHKSLGLIAQDVETVFPQLVTGSEEDVKYLDYNGLVPVLIGAIKEMKKYYDGKIANLETQVAELTKQ